MVNKKYILLDKEKNDAEEDFFSTAFSFPLDNILKYLLGIDKDDKIVERVESLQSSNPIFKDRVEGTKIFIENHDIKTIEAYHSLEYEKSKEFIEKTKILFNPNDDRRDDLLNSIVENSSPITGFGSLLKMELESFEEKSNRKADFKPNTVVRIYNALKEKIIPKDFLLDKNKMICHFGQYDIFQKNTSEINKHKKSKKR